MNTTIENMFETELTKLYQDGYNDGYNHGLHNLYNPKLDHLEYIEGYNDGQTDASELE
jgi:hypothetical protein